MTETNVIDDPSTTGKAVLVVDDHRVVRNLIVTILESEGLRVLDADSGPAALKILGERGADIGCVLQDLSMPEMPGEDVIAAMLELDPGLPIIVMSVDEEAYGRLKLDGMNIAGYVQKPFEAELLVSNIRSVLTAQY